ncbi:helix-turn-helix domain-containing protein [Winogradskyella sp.]|uniref:helix-turn-helix domain-containing protein n=1 Tax=Winogradskyella sp. TaxID=1883156 RepID=UPI0026085116|nr:helix-turn-helix transcriptional regulator [Winogradskyella sp.]
MRHMRIQKNLKQKFVADRCGFTHSGYNLMEKGQRNVTLFSLYKIAKALDEPIEHLFKFSGIEELDKIR